jgi:hypothetical protein
MNIGMKAAIRDMWIQTQGIRLQDTKTETEKRAANAKKNFRFSGELLPLPMFTMPSHADGYFAMPYRKPGCLLRALRREAGKRYDPEMIEAFFSRLNTLFGQLASDFPIKITFPSCRKI